MRGGWTLADADGEIIAIPGDLTDENFVDRLSGDAGDVDILVNLAGRTAHAPFLDSDPRSGAPPGN